MFDFKICYFLCIEHFDSSAFCVFWPTQSLDFQLSLVPKFLLTFLFFQDAPFVISISCVWFFSFSMCVWWCNGEEVELQLHRLAHSVVNTKNCSCKEWEKTPESVSKIGYQLFGWSVIFCCFFFSIGEFCEHYSLSRNDDYFEHDMMNSKKKVPKRTDDYFECDESKNVFKTSVLFASISF